MIFVMYTRVFVLCFYPCLCLVLQADSVLLVGERMCLALCMKASGQKQVRSAWHVSLLFLAPRSSQLSDGELFMVGMHTLCLHAQTSCCLLHLPCRPATRHLAAREQQPSRGGPFYIALATRHKVGIRPLLPCLYIYITHSVHWLPAVC